MMDVQELMNENMKVLMKEMAVNIRHNIIDTMKTQTTIKETTNLTPISPTEPITQSPQPIPQVEEPNNLIEDMDIEKSQIKVRHQRLPMKMKRKKKKKKNKVKKIILTQHGKIKKEPQLKSRG